MNRTKLVLHILCLNLLMACKSVEGVDGSGGPFPVGNWVWYVQEDYPVYLHLKSDHTFKEDWSSEGIVQRGNWELKGDSLYFEYVYEMTSERKGFRVEESEGALLLHKAGGDFIKYEPQDD